MKRAMFLLVLVTAAAFGGFTVSSYAKAGDEAEIRKLNENFVTAMRAKDVNKIMSFYQTGNELVAFDVVPPREYDGWDAYKKDWQEFIAMVPGTLAVEQTGLKSESGGNLAYGRSIVHFSG